jgi:hypothetical protein
MGWIKRNLFFVIGGVLALGLLGGAGFLIYKGMSRNSQASDKLNEIYGNLGNLPSPGNGKTNNTDIARYQEQQIRAWIGTAADYFRPIPAIPANRSVTSEAYASALRKTIDLLQHEAEGSNVTLPPKYDFSFSAQLQLMKFADGSLEPLARQLGEVKAISEILFATRINSLDSIQRVRVSDDDAQGSQSDYTDKHPLTNDLAVVTPYVITFRCFTPELSRVMAGFASSSNTFIIKSINVQPAGTAPAAFGPGDAAGELPPARYTYPGARHLPGDFAAPPPAAPAPQPGPGRSGLQTVLKEQLLRVVVEVELVKLLPKS